MSTNPRPESRISELEAQMATHGARIRELSDDTAESLRDLKQDIKNLDEGITASYKSIGDTFVALGEDLDTVIATMATKEDIADLKTAQDARLSRIEATQEQILKLLQAKQD
ncbi:MAG TPA: hypothetical protein VHV10_20680 [Ktedonobacteraceae bacterium]|jgi:uncharacterized coiled-coil protein SlyX|nr:hypothetical protein [Ktedonobacteraceae bacterium]